MFRNVDNNIQNLTNEILLQELENEGSELLEDEEVSLRLKLRQLWKQRITFSTKSQSKVVQFGTLNIFIEVLKQDLDKTTY